VRRVNINGTDFTNYKVVCMYDGATVKALKSQMRSRTFDNYNNNDNVNIDIDINISININININK